MPPNTSKYPGPLHGQNTHAERTSLEAWLKPRRPWREAWGVTLLSIGIYLGLACYSFTPTDYTFSSLSSSIHNLAGPLGARAAAHILGRFGLVGMSWPFIFAVWGLLTTIGHVTIPTPKRFLGLILISILGSGACHVFLTPILVFAEPSFGYGGILGQIIGGGLLKYLGYGGATIALTGLAILSLLATDNLNITALYFRNRQLSIEVLFEMRRFIRKKMRQDVPKIRSIALESFLIFKTILHYFVWNWAWRKLTGKPALPKPSHWSPLAMARAQARAKNLLEKSKINARGDTKSSALKDHGGAGASMGAGSSNKNSDSFSPSESH